MSQFASALYNGDTPAAEVIARAKYWFDEGNALVPYTNGFCPITGDSSCYRDPDGNHYYRRDCSGLASMALHMNHSATTADFKHGAFGFERLTNDADAKPGDLVLSTDKNGSGFNHTIIFERWIDSNSWKGYDGGDMPVRHPTFHVSKSGGTITNMDRDDYYGRTFHVFRTPHVIQSGICTPKTCAQIGCGSLTASENCGTPLNCGCASGQTCEDGQCVTTPPPSTSYAKAWWAGTLRNGGRCVQPSGSDPVAAGAVVAMNACDKDFVRQRWYMTGNRALKNVKSELCIEPDSIEHNELTRQRVCGGSEQIWRFYDMQIVNGQTGQCADVPAADYRSGQVVIQWPCHGGENQSFRYMPHTGELKINGWCLDAGSAANLTKVTLQACDGTKSQQWIDDHGGFVSVVATTSPRCLALEGGATASYGAKLIVTNCDDSVPQMWALRGQIHAYDSSFCLKNSSYGPEVKLATCDPSQPEQRFTFWMNR